MSLSVVLLCRNQAKHLPTTINLLSDCAEHINQFVLVDDASQDESPTLVAKAAAQLEHAHAILHKRNIGVVAAMRDALSKCTESYVHFLACDDAIHSQFYPHCLSLLKNFPQAGLCSTATELMREDGGLIGEFRASRPLKSAGYISARNARNALVWLDSWFMGNATIFNRDKLFAIGGFKEDLEGYSDAYACIRLALRHGACYSPALMAQKRLHDHAYGRSMYAPTNSARLLTILTRHMEEDAEDLFDSTLIKRIRGRWKFNTASLGRRHRSSDESSMIQVINFLRYKPFDIVSVLHRHKPAGSLRGSTTK